MNFSRKFGSFCIDAGSIFSLIGIWPRFIEPRLLQTTTLNLPFAPLRGKKIVHFTDLHFHAGTSKKFLKKLQKKILSLKPDLLFFTGDFLCYSRLEAAEALQAFLTPLEAPLGAYCVLGNHDYSQYVSRDGEGNYVIRQPVNPLKGLLNGVQTAFSTRVTPLGTPSEGARNTSLHAPLMTLLEKTPFQVLENAHVFLPQGINIVGLGEYALGKCQPTQAFAAHRPEAPTIVLVHNPDAFPHLHAFPGDLFLTGHTHGEQVHFPAPPFLRKISQRLTRLENPTLSRGLYTFEKRNLYVNRGVSGHKPFRFCSLPELLVINCL